ncbi:hypothetical protein [Ureibacillus aquaedulcis]|uniref:DUF1508 domain-containing protein n=1 Tax=Ureibacillus aquaedulcis TaxID=3058421 RepID=A0ABT8GPW3_9BACL|nr:hypothetical protein [Ureibacillus sp. BA0131]MDN4493453.1 hypothetical protein [Ureibacillus sp. BA0131]
MWVITVFENNTYRMFEYESEKQANLALEGLKSSAILSYTN